ncbi:GNAT family N-acetyltransferase [Rhodospirillum rubrum]|uniref:GNAT family N-acetyltransferase n=1 Tax=Rhodospirillum rubrum TaxID=1085 RepID=UPI001F5BB20D|nr:GNAT family N-acetyltransferase [Rhodospirillum rubrum]
MMPQPAPFRLPAVAMPQRPARPLRFPLPPLEAMTARGVALRGETPGDLGFLRQLYAAGRAVEMRMLNDTWDRETKRDFLEKQFSYQYLHHATHYGDGDFALITLGGRPIGKLYLQWRLAGGLPAEVRVFDFLLLPALRGQGIGSLVLAALLRRAARLNAAVSLHVEPINPARRLYARFGFQPMGVEAASGALLMGWRDGPLDPKPRLERST